MLCVCAFVLVIPVAVWKRRLECVRFCTGLALDLDGVVAPPCVTNLSWYAHVHRVKALPVSPSLRPASTHAEGPTRALGCPATTPAWPAKTSTTVNTYG